MENHPGRQDRVAYSFRAGTFDLREWCPGLWFEGDDGRAIAVQLDGNWEKLFSGLSSLGTVLASARSGPVYAADAWWSPDFQMIPGTGLFFDAQSGTEVRTAALGSVTAVVEHLSNQQIASLQFRDRKGNGSLKIMMTNGTDLQAFEDLIICLATTQMPALDRDNVKLNSFSITPEADAVRDLWKGISRSSPGRWFPGLSGVSRLTAIRSAGKDLAWRVNVPVVHQVIETMTCSQATLMGRVNCGGTSLPLRLGLTHWKDCHCGQTFFSPSSQLTLRREASSWQAWALQLSNKELVMEIYDESGNFAASFVLDKEATSEQRRIWQDCLEAER